MVIVLWILIVILGLVALFYRSKAKEFESLFELSKGYYQYEGSIEFNRPPATDPKLNKDGSIAKKRGRKPANVKTT